MIPLMIHECKQLLKSNDFSYLRQRDKRRRQEIVNECFMHGGKPHSLDGLASLGCRVPLLMKMKLFHFLHRFGFDKCVLGERYSGLQECCSNVSYRLPWMNGKYHWFLNRIIKSADHRFSDLARTCEERNQPWEANYTRSQSFFPIRSNVNEWCISSKGHGTLVITATTTTHMFNSLLIERCRRLFFAYSHKSGLCVEDAARNKPSFKRPPSLHPRPQSLWQKGTMKTLVLIVMLVPALILADDSVSV